jgi:translocation and assembly module TamB
VRLSGRLGRGAQGFVADEFTIENDEFRFSADGRYASDAADVTLEIALSDLALVTDRAEGRIEIEGSATGEGGPVALELVASVPSGSLAGRSLRDARFAFSGGLVNVDATAGRPYGEGIEGTLDGRAFVDGEGVDLSGDLVATAEQRSLQGLDFVAGGARITGDLAQDAAGLITGEIVLDASDIATLAALALTEAEGAVDARIALSPVDGLQNAELEADIDGLAIEQATIGQAALDATIADLFGVPKIEGTLDGADIAAAGVDIDTLRATASRKGARTDFEAEAALGTGTDIAVEGALEDTDTGLRLELSQANLTQGQTAARLLQPATVTVEGQRITLGELALDIDGGEVRAAGVIDDTLDLDVTIAQLPLAIANTVMPDLDAAGTLEGTATVAGTRDQPDVAFDLTGAGLSAAPLRDLGLPSIDLAATGRSAGDRLSIDADITAAGGIAVSAAGSIPLGDGELDLDLSLVDFPLATIDALAGNRGLAGSLTADAAVSGPIAAPRVQFDARGSGLSATQLSEFGIEPLAVTATGTYADNAIALNSATVSNGQGIDISASGRVPFTGAGLDLNVQGNAPLSLANRPLAERGTRVEGDLQFSVALSGSLQAPQYSGTVSTSNTAIVDPETNIQLEGVAVQAALQGQQVTINSFTSRLSTGGTITVGGTISLDAAAAFPADIAITLDRTRYVDGDFLIATASGSLTITGSLTRDPLISGTINVEQAEIGIPDNLGSAAALTDVEHIAPPPAVAATLERAGTSAAGDPPTPTARPSVARLDIQVNAPNRIFIRGRGLDAEVGGTIRLQGPVSSLEPVGGFELIRGRLSILGRRIVFDSGTVTLIGDLDPFVNLQASSQSGDTTVIITISGRASDIDIDFSSQPVLPEDEVIARLIFDRGIAELSPFQIAQLAAAVAELSGGQNTSLLGQLRQGTGLDDLDVVTDEEGNAAVRAGRYIRDNVYLGVQAGSGDSSEVTIDLDITENLKARGAAGADGDTSLGLFYERDY